MKVPEGSDGKMGKMERKVDGNLVVKTKMLLFVGTLVVACFGFM